MYRPLPVPPQLVEFIEGGSKFILVGHKEPDGDCVGSQLALASALRRRGKIAIPCSAGPFKRTEIIPYADRFITRIGAAEKEGASVIIVDCSSAERTGDLEPALKGLPTAVIDHHARGDTEGENPGGVVFLDPRAPSVTFMILELIEALGLSPTAEEAELLFFGLCTDTGFFRHVEAGGEAIFAAAARLARAGASPKETFAAMNGGKSLGSRILMGHILSRVESHYGGRLLLSTEEYEETRRFGLEGRDSDNLYQLLQSVSGVEAIVIIRQEKADSCTVGLRSRSRVNVAEVAARFGGGGHKNAAGINISGLIEDIRPRLIEAFRELLRPPEGP
jgi:phosphoesterase RecJ-like protein